MMFDTGADAIRFVEKYLDQLNQAVVRVAPTAWNIAKGVKRTEGLGYIIIGCVDVIAALVVIALAVHWLPRLWVWALKYERDDGDGGGYAAAIFGSAVPSLLAAIWFGCGMGYLLNIWNWAALFAPDLAIAHDVLVKVLAPR
jgi:hypothetical protein